MISSTTPSPRRESDGSSLLIRRSRGWPSAIARSPSRITSGRAQLPPTKPSIEPSGWIRPRAPGRAEVGRRTATTVASANDWPARSSSTARARSEAGGVIAAPPAGIDWLRRHSLLVEDRPDLLGRQGNVDVPDAQVPEGIDDRVVDRGWSPDGGRLTDALGADRVV